MEHGYKRYRSMNPKLLCRCEVCRTGHAVKRAQERAEGLQPMNGCGGVGTIEHDPAGAIILQPAVYKTLMAFMYDGASNEIIARRTGVQKTTVSRRLSAIQVALGLPTRTALALAVERRDVRVRSTTHGEKPSDPARSRKGA